MVHASASDPLLRRYRIDPVPARKVGDDQLPASRVLPEGAAVQGRGAAFAHPEDLVATGRGELLLSCTSAGCTCCSIATPRSRTSGRWISSRYNVISGPRTRAKHRARDCGSAWGLHLGGIPDASRRDGGFFAADGRTNPQRQPLALVGGGSSCLS
jgi:hypothetical protein